MVCQGKEGALNPVHSKMKLLCPIVSSSLRLTAALQTIAKVGKGLPRYMHIIYMHAHSNHPARMHVPIPDTQKLTPFLHQAYQADSRGLGIKRYLSASPNDKRWF